MANKLQKIQLGAPPFIDGNGDSPNAELSVQVMERCDTLKLKDGTGKCTSDGAMKTAAKLMLQRNTEDVSAQDWYTPLTDAEKAESKMSIDVSGNATLNVDEIDAIFEIIRQHIPTDDSDMEGRITSPGCYEDAAIAIHERFPKVSIEAAKYFVRFKDPEVLRVLLANASHANPDGFTTDEMLNITDIKDWFQGNIEIKTFDELSLTNIVGLDNNAFRGCTSLVSIKTPDAVNMFPNNLFYGCVNLRSFNADNKCLIKAGQNISNGSFYGCGFESVELEDGWIYNALPSIFSECHNLKKIKIGNNTTNIIPYATCNNCSAIEEVEIGDMFTTIDSWSFRGSVNMKKFIIKSPTPLVINSNAFAFVSYAQLPSFYVPDESLEAYKEANWWKDRAGKIFPMSMLETS